MTIAEHGFYFHVKSDFHDHIRLRYCWPLDNLPVSCPCGARFNVDHAQICKLSGFIHVRHNRKLIERLKSGNSSAVYRYIRNLTGSNGIPQSVYFKNVSASMDSDKASLFNQYFHSVYGPVQDLPLSHDLPKPSQSFGDISIDELDVYEVLMSLDTSKAMGCDGISPMLLKHCAIPLLQPLHHLFTLSLIQSYLPSQWRSHLIKPILKSGPIHLVENYRPISLLCIVSKVLEKIVHKKLVDYVLNSISDSQLVSFMIVPLCNSS